MLLMRLIQSETRAGMILFIIGNITIFGEQAEQLEMGQGRLNTLQGALA